MKATTALLLGILVLLLVIALLGALIYTELWNEAHPTATVDWLRLYGAVSAYNATQTALAAVP